MVMEVVLGDPTVIMTFWLPPTVEMKLCESLEIRAEVSVLLFFTSVPQKCLGFANEGFYMSR